MKKTWHRMNWLERGTVVLGSITILTNSLGVVLPPHEWWRLFVVAAWSITVPYIFLAASYRELVDEAQALTKEAQDLSAELLAELRKRDEPWRLS